MTSNEILNAQEDFIGFDIDDMSFNDVHFRKMGVMDVIDYIKKKSKDQTQSCISSPEANSENNQSKVNKSVNVVDIQPTLDNLETIKIPLSTPGYINEDLQAIQSSSKQTVFSFKTYDIKITTTNNTRGNIEINDTKRKYVDPMAITQSFSFMVKALKYVFKHLKTHELLIASRVCTTWNMIAMNKALWKTVHLKNSMICNWNKFIAAIDSHGSVALDTRRMLIPSKVEEYEKFWLDFTIAIKKAQQLKCIELYRCPAKVVEDTIYSLPKLTVLKATSIKNPNTSEEEKNSIEFITLNLHSVRQLTHLTELSIKGLSGIKLTNLPSFKNLVHLKSLSITSIQRFPRDIYRSLETITTNLTSFEIGDCDCFSKSFPGVLKRLINLTSLRLENCHGEFENIAQEIFSSIRSLNKLKILELINIRFSNNVKNELEKCDGIKALLIIPVYVSQSATTNRLIIDCLMRLSSTLTHLVWGLTYELFQVTDLFITQYPSNQHPIYYNLESSQAEETNHIPILRTIKPTQQPEKNPVTAKDEEKNKLNTIDILSVSGFEKLLKTMMENTKFKVVKTRVASVTQVHLLEHFNNL